MGFNARVEGDIRQFENPEIAIVPPMPTCPSSSQTGDDDMDTLGNSGPHIVPLEAMDITLTETTIKSSLKAAIILLKPFSLEQEHILSFRAQQLYIFPKNSNLVITSSKPLMVV